MTPQQFKEHKALIGKTNEGINSLNDKLLTMFNVVNKLSDYLGNQDRDGILQDILTEIQKE